MSKESEVIGYKIRVCKLMWLKQKPGTDWEDRN